MALVQTSVNARLKPQNLFESEPIGTELAKFFFCFLEHSEIKIPFGG
ncbi:MAG TPA: hypothetical protein VLK27_03620 [Chthoniobacterales bacterium]|nr:hypothetical protein [Chthoniobacterales bacterium]